MASISNSKLIEQKQSHKQQYDGAAPKKDLIAYNYYSNFIREEMKQKHPEATSCELNKLIGMAFQKLTADDLSVFDELAYEDEMEHYEAGKKTQASLEDHKKTPIDKTEKDNMDEYISKSSVTTPSISISDVSSSHQSSSMTNQSIGNKSNEAISDTTAIVINANKSSLYHPTMKEYDLKGVRVYKDKKSKWVAYFIYDKYRYLGSFATRNEADLAVEILCNEIVQSNINDKESIDELVTHIRHSVRNA